MFYQVLILLSLAHGWECTSCISHHHIMFYQVLILLSLAHGWECTYHGFYDDGEVLRGQEGHIGAAVCQSAAAAIVPTRRTELGRVGCNSISDMCVSARLFSHFLNHLYKVAKKENFTHPMC
jgi:hypothetical protein